MTNIPSQRSYERVPTPTLEEALDNAREQKWNLLDQLAAAEVTIAALSNVIRERRTA